MGRITEAQAAFADIYDKDLWGLATGEWAAPRPGEETEADRMARLVGLIQQLIALNDIKSVVEFGCGFWSYAKQIDFTGVNYDGFDVVEGIVSHNNATYGRENIHFHRVADGVRLPPADLLISKDVLQHLPTAHVQYYFDLFKRNFKYMLIGNDVEPSDNLNGDAPPGGYRALRFELPPFNEPNIVVQRWITADFGIHTVKNFCLFVNRPDPVREGFILRDSPEIPAPAPTASAAPAVTRGPLRSLAHAAIVQVPPLARLSGAILERIRRP
jgi:hypothetical protein